MRGERAREEGLPSHRRVLLTAMRADARTPGRRVGGGGKDASGMTEAEARATLTAFDGVGPLPLERLIAERPREPAAGGWTLRALHRASSRALRALAGRQDHAPWSRAAADTAGATAGGAGVPLAAFDGPASLECWLAERPWQAAPGGWTVLGELWGWRFRLEPGPGGVRVVGSADGCGDAVWFVPAGRERAPPWRRRRSGEGRKP